MNEFQNSNNSRNYFPINEEYIYNNNINEKDINKNINNNFDANKNDFNYLINNKDNNIFGLNFHQDEGDEDEEINPFHFIKFTQNKNEDKNNNKNDDYINNMIANSNKISYRNNNASVNVNANNYEYKVKNNRNLINNNMKNSIFMDDEPFQISTSKYTESNLTNDNQSLYSNSRINKYYMNIENKNKNKNNIGNNNNMISRRENKYNTFDFSQKEYNEFNQKKYNKNKYNKEINYNNNNNFGTQEMKRNSKNKEKNLKEVQNKLKNDLLLNNNKKNHIDNKSTLHISNPFIIPNKKASSKKNISVNHNLAKSNNFKLKKMDNRAIQNNNYNITEMNSSFNTNISSLNNQNNIKKNNSFRTYNNINANNIQKFNSIDYVNNNHNTITKEMDLKKIYSKRQKAELDMVRGNFMYDKKLFNFDIRNGSNTINYNKFIKSTEPIISINYKNIQKFYPLIRKKFDNEITYINNNTTIDINKKSHIHNSNININNSHFEKYQPFINENNNYKLSNSLSPYFQNENNNQNYSKNTNNLNSIRNNNNQLIKKKNKIPIREKNYKKFENSERNIKFNNNNYNKNTNKNYCEEEEGNQADKNNNNNKIDKDGLSISFKQRIYDWLVDIDIIKDKIIKLDSLPMICINGVLLCDLINRCEGRNEILKGIIRKTSTKSQIQVNINKVMDYLRSLEKFPSRHLWNNQEILKGNSLVIWQLLDDIYNFYGNKVTFNRRHQKMSCKKNLNKTFTMERLNKSRILDKFDKNDNNFGRNSENYKTKTPSKYIQNSKSNTHHNNNNNNNFINDENSFYTNDNDYSKYTYTPGINNNNKIKNKKKKKSDNVHINNYNKDINNKNDTNQYSMNEINKKIKRPLENNKKVHNMEEKNKLMNYNFDYKRTKESPHKNNRNNINHTNDNFYESKMFSIDNEFDNDKGRNINNRNNEDKSFQRNFDVSSIYSDKFTNVDKSNKSFTGNNRLRFKKNNNLKFGNSSRYNINNNNNNNNQSFYSTKSENKIRNKGCFLLFEKSSINRLKEKIGTFQKYTTNDVDTFDFRDI